MSTIGPNVNPMSSKFLATASKVASTQISTVRSEKDIKPKDDKHTKEQEEIDTFMFTKEETSISTEANEANLTGVTAQEAKKQRKQEKSSESTLFGRDAEVNGEKESAGKTAAGTNKGNTEEIGLKEKVEILSIMNRDPHEITKDIPEHLLTVAKGVVAGQMPNNKPAESITGLKEVNDTVPIELKPLKNIDIMPIHDTDNKPIPMDMGTEANTD